MKVWIFCLTLLAAPSLYIKQLEDWNNYWCYMIMQQMNWHWSRNCILVFCISIATLWRLKECNNYRKTGRTRNSAMTLSCHVQISFLSMKCLIIFRAQLLIFEIHTKQIPAQTGMVWRRQTSPQGPISQVSQYVTFPFPPSQSPSNQNLMFCLLHLDVITQRPPNWSPLLMAKGSTVQMALIVLLGTHRKAPLNFHG